MNNCFSIYHTSWISSGPKSNLNCDNIPTKAILFFLSCSEVNSIWLITSELANQRTRKVLFTCVVYTNYKYATYFKQLKQELLTNIWKRSRKLLRLVKLLSPFILICSCFSDFRFHFLIDFMDYLRLWKESTDNRPGNFTQNARGRMFLSWLNIWRLKDDSSFSYWGYQVPSPGRYRVCAHRAVLSGSSGGVFWESTQNPKAQWQSWHPCIWV